MAKSHYKISAYRWRLICHNKIFEQGEIPEMNNRNKELLEHINKKRAANDKKKFRLALIIALIPTIFFILYHAIAVIYALFFITNS